MSSAAQTGAQIISLLQAANCSTVDLINDALAITVANAKVDLNVTSLISVDLRLSITDIET